MTGNEILGLIMLASMMGIIFVGVPISFTLLYIALVFGSIGLGLDPTFNLAYLQIWASMKDDILPAVPLFIFMGFMSEQAGLMNRLFEALRNILAPVRGSLYLAVLLTATIFAMATGIIGAAVTVLGIVAGPIMVKAGYDARLSAGAIAAGGSLGILIPPSVMLLVMGPLLGVPVNHLYSAAFGPGFLLAALYIAYCLARSFFDPKLGPPVPVDERITSLRKLGYEFVVGVVPLAVLIATTLGTIIGGVATATEAASCGALGATLLALAYRKLTLEALKNAAISTIVTSSMVLFLVVGSNLFGAVFNQLGAASLIKGAVAVIPLPDMGKLLGDHGDHLPAGLALRVAGDRAGLPADLPAGGRSAGHRPPQAGADAVVRCRCRREPADGLPESARGDVGVLPEERDAPMGIGDDLQRDGAVHGDPGCLRPAAGDLARARALAAQGAEVKFAASAGMG